MDNDKCCTCDNCYAHSRNTSDVRDKGFLGAGEQQQRRHSKCYYEFCIKYKSYSTYCISCYCYSCSVDYEYS